MMEKPARSSQRSQERNQWQALFQQNTGDPVQTLVTIFEKELPKIERSLIPSIVELRHKDLPHLRVRNHSTATKIVVCFAQYYACFARLAGTRGKPFVAKRQNFGGKGLSISTK